jgi:hypothetical protein
MFTCAYCGTQFTQHVPNCPNCGAAIKVTTAPKEKDSLREICLKYEGVNNLYIDEAIDAKRMKTIRENFNIPAAETVVMAYDDTIFGNNKLGFAVCVGGLYWKNDWSVTSKRSRLTWEEFSKREIKLEQYQVSLDKGDNLGVAGCGSDYIRKSIEKMLKEIRAAFRGADF